MCMCTRIAVAWNIAASGCSLAVMQVLVLVVDMGPRYSG